VEITKFSAVTAARPRTLTQGSPLTLRRRGEGWRVTSGVAGASYMRGVNPSLINHNSTVPTAVAGTRDAFGAAEQAAPPRGVPR
jgi:hypothetical protein